MLTLVSQLYIQRAAELLQAANIPDDQLRTHTAYILYVLEHDIQCRLKQVISPIAKPTIDLSQYASPGESVSIQSFCMQS